MKKIIIAISVFIFVFLIYNKSQVFDNGDSHYTIYVAQSIINEGNFDLDEFSKIIENNVAVRYSVIHLNNHAFFLYPVGTAFLISPLVVITNKLSHLPVFYYLVNPLEVSHLIANLIIALTVLIIFLTAKLYINTFYSLILAFVFAFGTSAYSSASKNLTQHGLIMLFTSLIIYILSTHIINKNKIHNGYAFVLIGFLSSFLYVIRPSALVVFIGFSYYIFHEYRKSFLIYIIPAVAVFTAFFIFNLKTYFTIFPPYYLPQTINMGFNNFSFEALFGHIISPNRGLLTFSPVSFFSAVGLYLKYKRKNITHLDHILISIVVLHSLLISSYPQWWAGWSFGPRLWSDMLPILFYFMLPFLSEVQNNRSYFIRISYLIFLLFGIYSIIVHYRGANREEVRLWNQYPTNIDKSPYRIWDWKDIQFLR